MNRPILTLMTLIFAGGISAHAAEMKAADATPGVTLTPAQIEDMGIKTREAVATTVVPQVAGLAVALDPAGFAQDLSAVLAARSAARAGRRQADRLTSLFRDDATVSRQAADAATAQAEADEAQRESLLAKFTLTWGPALAREATSTNSALLADLVAGRASLVRAEFPNVEWSEPPKAVTLVMPSKSARGVRASVHSTLAGANVLIEGTGPAYLMVVPAGEGTALRPGLRLAASAEAPGQARPGALIERSAIIVFDGAEWSYLAEASGKFTRRRVDVAGGGQGDEVAVTGVSPGAQVATAGAALLLAAEQRGVLGTGEAD